MYRVEKAGVLAEVFTSLLEKFMPTNETVARPQYAMAATGHNFEAAPLAEQRRRRVRRNRAVVSAAAVKPSWF